MRQKVGVIGGSQGMGKWFLEFLNNRGFNTGFSSADSRSQYISNIQLVSDSDIVILAVPISKISVVLDEIYPYLDGRLLIDICSVKTGVMEKYLALKATYPDVECRYLSIHPMFAPSVRKVNGQTILFNFESHQGLWEPWKNLFLEDGAEILDIDAERHDKTMGVIQGLNHFNVFVSAKTLSALDVELSLIKKLSSPSYRIFIIFFTRYVMQNPRLYAEIQMYNPYVKEVVEMFMREAAQLLDIINKKQVEAFEDYVMEMQSYYSTNLEDTHLSNYLIEKLGDYIHSKEKTSAE